MEAALVLDAKARVGEGAFWHFEEKTLYWLDIEGKFLHRFDPATGRDTSITLGGRVGCMVPTREGTLLLAGEKGIEEFYPESGKRLFVCDPEPDRPTNRLNDGKCSPEGRFWFGSLSMVKEPNAAAFYMMDHDRTVTKKLDGLTNSNGIGWSPDGKTLYHIDTPTRLVSAWDYDSVSGKIGNRGVVVRFPDDPSTGRPDGMTVDADGNLWIAHWLGSRVSCWTPQGERIREIRVPAARVTSVAFGGDGLETLFITTASEGMTSEEHAQEPHAGGLFACSPGVKGMRVNFFTAAQS